MVQLKTLLSVSVATAAVATPDNCQSIGRSSFFSCGYAGVACHWCGPGNMWNPLSKDFDPSNGTCTSVGSSPPAGMNCPPQQQGCKAHVQQDTCNDDPSCKWCHLWEQGWPSCDSINASQNSLQATCDKPDPNITGTITTIAANEEESCMKEDYSCARCMNPCCCEGLVCDTSGPPKCLKPSNNTPSSATALERVLV